MKDTAELAQRAAIQPQLNLIWTAVVDIAPVEDLGVCPSGHRYMVPILGGDFFAGPGIEGLSGSILPGGADRQLVDHSGFKTLDAIYEMKTTDGSVLSIRNRVKVDLNSPEGPCRLSVISVTAPSGPLEWMNRRVFLGTLESARPERDAVIIRSWGQK